MTFIDSIILIAFPLGMLMVAFGGMSLRHRILMTLGSVVCSLSMIPLGIRLLSNGSQALDYLYGGMALMAGALLLILGILGTLGIVLKSQTNPFATTVKS